MKKLIVGFAVFGSLMLVGAAGRALAADPAAGGGDDKAATAGGAGGDDANTTYKAKTVYDFEDDTVEGDLQRPDGELVSAQKKAEHSSLIEIRKDFIPEMLKTLEDI
ncbi:MAG TPA: hypothetical protein VN853_17770 [Polyangia bacterium]|nr:hypothetical protein [Polyangia bacterium]